MHELTEGLLCAALGVHLVLAWLLFFISRQARRAILQIRQRACLAHSCLLPRSNRNNGKMESDRIDQIIDEMLCETAHDSQACSAPDEPVSGPTQVSDDKCNVRKDCERLVALAAGGQARQYGLAVRGKSLTADQVDTLDDSEVERLYARYEARRGGDYEDAAVSSAPALCGDGIFVSPDPGRKPARAHC